MSCQVHQYTLKIMALKQKSGKSGQQLDLWKKLHVFPALIFDCLVMVINCGEKTLKIIGSSYYAPQNNSSECLLYFHSWNRFYLCNLF